MPRIATWELRNSTVMTEQEVRVTSPRNVTEDQRADGHISYISETCRVWNPSSGEGLTQTRQETTWKACAD